MSHSLENSIQDPSGNGVVGHSPDSGSVHWQDTRTSSSSHKWLLLLVISWVIGVFYAFSAFLLLDYRLFYPDDQERLVEFEKTDFAKGLEGYLLKQGLIPRLNSNEIKTDASEFLSYKVGHIFHFWNPGCSCDRANFAHVKKLIRQFSQQGMNFYIVPNQPLNDGKNEWEQLLQQYPDHLRIVHQGELTSAKEGLTIPASPSAAVLDTKGKLLYFGPYALGGVCRPDENGLIETVLKGTLNGVPPKYSYVGGFGCFCSWRGE